MSSRSFDLSEARAKRVAKRIIDGDMPTNYAQVLDALSEEDVHNPAGSVERLIALFYECGYQGLATTVGGACAYEAYKRNQERYALVRGIAPFVEEIVESMQEEL